MIVVRSQDEERLVECIAVYIGSKHSVDKHTIFGMAGVVGYELGTYASKEAAVAVMDEMERHTEAYAGRGFVYSMPDISGVVPV